MRIPNWLARILWKEAEKLIYIAAETIAKVIIQARSGLTKKEKKDIIDELVIKLKEILKGYGIEL